MCGVPDRAQNYRGLLVSHRAGHPGASIHGCINLVHLHQGGAPTITSPTNVWNEPTGAGAAASTMHMHRGVARSRLTGRNQVL